MKRHLPTSAFVLALFAVVWAPVAVHSQATGQLNGVVTDNRGDALPGATVTVTNVATNLSRTTITGVDGFFSAPLLPPGDYRVAATLEGFSPLTREGVRVSAAETARVDLVLAVGEVSEAVTVVAEAPLIETSNATLGVVIDKATIVELPLNGRNFTQLGTLVPGVVEPPARLGGAAGDADAGINGFGAATAGFSVNGVRSQSNNFLLDGSTNNDTFNTGFVLRPPPDAIEEFKILTHSYSAEFGRNAGSIVNVVTKSGSNEVHGSLWEFNRDDSLESKNFFAPDDQEKPTLEQNQFGGSLGGPLLVDRLFGFGYYEGFRNTRGTTQNFTVFSAAQRAGDFSGGAPIIDPQTGLPFPGNVIPQDRLDPSALQIVNQFMPLPNTGTNRFITSPDVTDNRNQFGLRLDFQANERNRLLVRFLQSESDRFAPPTVRPIGTVSASELDDYMVSLTSTIGANAFNQVRASLNKIDADPTITSGLSNSEFGLNIPNINPLASGLAQLTVAGFPSLGDPNQPFVKRENEVTQLTNDFTYLRGKHTLKAGLDLREEEMFIGFINRPNGDYTFNGRFTGSAAADFLLGLPSQFRTAVPGADSINEGEGLLYGVYIQDEFRPTARITLNLGLRYEVAEPFEDSGDALNSFRPGQQSTRFPDAPTGLVYPGDAGVPAGTYETDKNNIAPRLAFVWDPWGDGKTSVRAGWGLFYDSIPGQGDFFQNAVLAPPFNPLLQLDEDAGISLRDPLANVTGGPTRFPPGIIFIGWGSNFTTPSYQHFNLTAQRQLGRKIGIEVGYVGSRGKNLPIFMEVNPRVVAPGQTTLGPRTFPAFSLVRPTFTVAKAWYDAFQANIRMRETRGITFNASYTWGHARDHVSGLNIGGEERPILPVDENDPASFSRALAREKGDALFDVRHRIVLNFAVRLPLFENKGPFVKHVLGNWQLNGILQYQTGYPFPIRVRGDDIRGLTSRPDQICDPNSGAPETVDQWFNTECFVPLSLAETATRQGNAGRNIIRGPDFQRVDLSLFKNIPLRGENALQLRIEAFNVFDRNNFAQPGNRVGDADYGVITATNGDGRIVQLGLKYSF